MPRLDGSIALSACPRLLASSDSLGYLGLKYRRTEGKPVFTQSVNQQSLFLRTEFHQPIKRLLPWAISDSYRDIDRQTAPAKVGRKQDHIGFVGTHPFGKRT